MTQCPWKIHWGVSQQQTTQCSKDEHVQAIDVVRRDGRTFAARVHGDPNHHGPAGNGITQISWLAGDRREYTGDWPGPCPLPGPSPCILHDGHYGNCAPA